MIEEMNSFAGELFMTQIVDSSTHKDENILDLIFTNNSDLIHSFTSMPTLHSISHHFLIEGRLKFNLIPSSSYSTNRRTFMNTLQGLNFFSEKTDWEGLINELSTVDWDQLFNDSTPEHV